MNSGAQWLSARAAIADRDRLGDREDPQGACEDGRAGDIPVGVGAAVCTQDPDLGGGAAVTVFERGLVRGDGRGAGRSGGARGTGAFGEYRVAVEAGLGAGV